VNLQADEAIRLMKTSPNGLTSSEANDRLAKHGQNILIGKKRVSFAGKFIVHLKDLFSVPLVIASILAAVGGMLELSLVVLVVVLVSTLSAYFSNGVRKRRWMPRDACQRTQCHFRGGN
jgi:Ca2+-transporting ATPase